MDAGSDQEPGWTNMGTGPNGTTFKAKASDYIVIPAKAGIQSLKKHRPIGRFWMPAFAGMTEFLLWGT
jgi:hypothetical protein